MKKYLSMAVLALAGAMMSGCGNEDDFANDSKQQPANVNNVVTLTTTVGLGESATNRAMGEGATNRALAAGGVKTFAAGERMAIVYKNKDGETVKAVSEALTDGDIITTDDEATNKKSATFTFTLTDPDRTVPVRYIYPATMAKETIATDATIDDAGTVDFGKLATQDGTLATLGSKLDLCTLDAASWTSGTLPTGTLENQLAILAITLKDEAGTSDITSGTTKLTVSDGTNTYNVNREAAAGPIYVAIRPTTSANISIEATSGGQGYYKTLTTKSYAASNGYPVSWKMTPATLLSTISSDYTAQNGETLYGKLGSNVKISIADGATVILHNVNINGTDDIDYVWGGINCEGNATIILSGTNTVKGFYHDYPGIYVLDGYTLTIKGTGSLNASSNGKGAGIGGGYGFDCGEIIINGGTITATGGDNAAGMGGGREAWYWGDITINGGTITATGGDYGAGIGSGGNSEEWFNENWGEMYSGNITINGGTITANGGCYAAGIGTGCFGSCRGVIIKNTVTRVTATKGVNAPDAIGNGFYGICASVTIGDTDVYIAESPFTYEP